MVLFDDLNVSLLNKCRLFKVKLSDFVVIVALLVLSIRTVLC